MEQANLITSTPDNRQGYGRLVWSKILLNLKNFVKAEQFKTWLDNTKFSQLDGNKLVISVKTNFIREWILNNYFLVIKNEISKIDGTIKKFSVVLNKESDNGLINPGLKVEKSIFSKLNPKFTFDNYVIGEGNNVAYRISKDIAFQSITYSHNNIFYIHSHVGMGKTHLLQSIASEFIKNNPNNCKTGYLSAEKFMYNFVNAVRNNTLFDLRNKINEIDIFLIDDIQFICGKESTQREFALTLNSLIESGKTIMIASSLPPYMLELQDGRTKSLLISSNTIHIKVFDYLLRFKILEFYNAKNSIKFDTKILNLIAEKITTNVRELEAALNNLTTYLLISSKEASLENIYAYIQSYMRSSVKKITVVSIINAVSKFYRISKADILSKKRAQKLVLGRQVVAYLAKELTTDSLKSIGEKLGGRNHATILYYLNKLNVLFAKNHNLIKDIHLIKSSITI